VSDRSAVKVIEPPVWLTRALPPNGESWNEPLSTVPPEMVYVPLDAGLDPRASTPGNPPSGVMIMRPPVWVTVPVPASPMVAWPLMVRTAELLRFNEPLPPALEPSDMPTAPWTLSAPPDSAAAPLPITPIKNWLVLSVLRL
jgi:hypothetical protein